MLLCDLDSVSDDTSSGNISSSSRTLNGERGRVAFRVERNDVVGSRESRGEGV